MENEISHFIAVPAYGELSAYELASLAEWFSPHFEIESVFDNFSLIQASDATVSSLARRCGGTYKFGKVCGTTIEELLENLSLPFEPKFNWTISAYNVPRELVDETTLAIEEYLKSKSLGKSRFISPDRVEGEGDANSFSISELKVRDLASTVLSEHGRRPSGFDVIISKSSEGKPLFASTSHVSDVFGYEKRDFSRSYQDPTTTIGPRLARILVNTACSSDRGTVLDPFCGLGTILQEAMICGYSVIGVDIDQANVQKTRTNLGWLKKDNSLPNKASYQVIRADAKRLGHLHLARIDAVATEPILIPKFETNPSAQTADGAIQKARATYLEVIKSTRAILRTGVRIALVTPEIIDSRGRKHSLSLSDLDSEDLEIYRPNIRGARLEPPIRVPTTKKKIIQRNVLVMRTH